MSEELSNLFSQIREQMKVRNRAIIGLTSIAIQHLMDNNYDKCEDTLRSLIISLEGGYEE
tara:strand:+ start:231 stop:410 length:180 start_codon:yes stop_codon:yes gene_type:complete